MKIVNFCGDNTYIIGEESYHVDGKNHNIQRIDGKWMVDGKSMTFTEMIKKGVVVKKTPEETLKDLEDVRQPMEDGNTVVVNGTSVFSFLMSVFRMLFRH